MSAARILTEAAALMREETTSNALFWALLADLLDTQARHRQDELLPALARAYLGGAP